MPSMNPWGADTVAKFMGGELHIRISGLKTRADMKKDLNGLVARSQDMKPAMQRIGFYLMGSTLRTFQAQGRPRKWKRLAPATIADRRRKGYGPGPILVRSGKLRDSLTKQGAAHQIFRVGSKSLQLSSSLPYFRAHQLGTSTIPRRAMQVLQRQDRSQISRIINDFVRDGKVSVGKL